MTTATKIQYATAVIMVLSGIILTFVCFFKRGDVSEAVLWYVAQALTFAGGVFGISVYFNSYKHETNNQFHTRRNDHISDSEKA